MHRLLNVFHLGREDVDESCRDHVTVVTALHLQHVLTEDDVGFGELDCVCCQCCENLICNTGMNKYSLTIH